jgi:hypothetical protein
MTEHWEDSLVEKHVTYTSNIDGKLLLVENVSACVNEETGEQFFAPAAVEKLHKMILGQTDRSPS